MKTITPSTIISLSIASVTLASNEAPTPSDRSEVPISMAYISKMGFDDNDNVQVVLDGMLPNACYEQADASFELKDRSISLKQFAYKKTDGVCGLEEELPEDLKQPVPYMQEVSLGQLKSGSYKLLFSSLDGLKTRDFYVSVAPTSTIDTLRYAGITNAFVPDVVNVGEKIRFMISGILNSSCVIFTERVPIEYLDDVIVGLPQVTPLFEGVCLPVVKPFVRELTLEPQVEGRYLLHIRSTNGRAVNRLFSVRAQ